MSLAALVLRHLTVLALSGKTLAGEDVRSSLLVPINEIGDGDARLTIAVFTDTAKADGRQVDGHDLIGASIEVTLALEIACFNQAPTKDGGGVEIFIPETDEGLETAIDIIERQALAEFQAGESVWAVLWRSCRFKTCGLHAVRGAAIEKSIRFAARRVEIALELVSDPVPGAPLPQFWANVLAAFTASGGKYAQLATTLRALIGGETLPDWKQWRNELGINDDSAVSVGFGPLDGITAETGGLTAAAVLSGEGSDATITVDANGAKLTPDTDPAHPIDLVEASDG